VEIVSKTMAVSKTETIGGRILSVRNNMQSLRVNNTIPVRPGDSGGPVALLGGGLLGINSGVHVGSSGEQYGFCTRPSPEWVAREIGVDVKAGRQDVEPTFGVLRDRQGAHLVLTLW
jgi:hypothetical protein